MFREIAAGESNPPNVTNLLFSDANHIRKSALKISRARGNSRTKVAPRRFVLRLSI